jgi:hypothetical protein
MILQDVLAAAGATLPDGGRVIIRSKPATLSPRQETYVDKEELGMCQVLLLTSLGPERRPIPPGMGGPITLGYYGPCRDRFNDSRWLVFVEELTVVGPDAPR